MFNAVYARGIWLGRRTDNNFYRSRGQRDWREHESRYDEQQLSDLRIPKQHSTGRRHGYQGHHAWEYRRPLHNNQSGFQFHYESQRHWIDIRRSRHEHGSDAGKLYCSGQHNRCRCDYSANYDRANRVDGSELRLYGNDGYNGHYQLNRKLD